jgi:integrase
MRERIIGALDTGCRRGEMLKIQNKQVDWRHRWIRILKEHSKTEVARVIPFGAGSRLEKLLRRRAFLGPDGYVFGEATTGAYVASLKSARETLLLLANGIKPTRAGSGKRVSNRKALAQIDLHWHGPSTRGVVTVGRRWRSRSRAAVARRALQHHHDPALHERACELPGRVDAPGARTTCQSCRTR